MQRAYFHATDLDAPYGADVDRTRAECDEEIANLVGSFCGYNVMGDEVHMPALDVDAPADPGYVVERVLRLTGEASAPVTIVPSSTLGNFHVYVDVELIWPDYRDLLLKLGYEGLIQQGYLRASLDRRGTFVRKPGVKKLASV